MAEREVDILGEAIANTEKEIFGDAVDADDLSEEGDDGQPDRSLEEMGEGLEGQHEEVAADEANTAEDGEEDGDDGEQAIRARDPETGKFVPKAEEPEKPLAAKPAEKPAETSMRGVPPGRLREETARAQAAEARAKQAEERAAAVESKSASEVAALNARLDGILMAQRVQQQPPAPAVEPPKKPDMFADPEGYEQWLTSSIESKFRTQLVESNLAAAHAQHGETFEKAYQAVTSLDKGDPANRSLVQRIWSSSNPGGELLKWHRQQETLREVGTDANAYKERIRTEAREALMKDPEVRKQILEELRAEASGANGGQPRSVTRIPKSLNSAAGGSSAQQNDPSMFDNSDRGAFESAFSD